MAQKKLVGWDAWETIHYGIPNLDLGPAASPAEAYAIVARGEAVWAILGGGVLALVDHMQPLEWYEHFVIQEGKVFRQELPEETALRQTRVQKLSDATGVGVTEA